MKIDTKYAPGLMRRLASSKAGALALAMDRLCYDMDDSDDRVTMRTPMYVGKDGGCGWIAPYVGPKDKDTDDKVHNYVDVMKLLRGARDELYAIGLGQMSV